MRKVSFILGAKVSTNEINIVIIFSSLQYSYTKYPIVFVFEVNTKHLSKLPHSVIFLTYA